MKILKCGSFNWFLLLPKIDDNTAYIPMLMMMMMMMMMDVFIRNHGVTTQGKYLQLVHKVVYSDAFIRMVGSL